MWCGWTAVADSDIVFDVVEFVETNSKPIRYYHTIHTKTINECLNSRCVQNRSNIISISFYRNWHSSSASILLFWWWERHSLGPAQLRRCIAVAGSTLRRGQRPGQVAHTHVPSAFLILSCLYGDIEILLIYFVKNYYKFYRISNPEGTSFEDLHGWPNSGL